MGMHKRNHSKRNVFELVCNIDSSIHRSLYKSGPLLFKNLVRCALCLRGKSKFYIYFDHRNMQSDFTSIYAQILGCIIMGFVTHHKGFFTSEAIRIRKVIYLGLTSGLCGSITTFATWNIQCNQACFLDPALAPTSYVGARVLAWLVCLATCIALSLKSLHFGHFLATFSPHSDANRPAAMAAASDDPFAESALIAAYLLATAAAVLVPAIQGSPQLAAAAGLGACGAFARYLLSSEPALPNLPCRHAGGQCGRHLGSRRPQHRLPEPAPRRRAGVAGRRCGVRRVGGLLRVPVDGVDAGERATLAPRRRRVPLRTRILRRRTARRRGHLRPPHPPPPRLCRQVEGRGGGGVGRGDGRGVKRNRGLAVNERAVRSSSSVRRSRDRGPCAASGWLATATARPAPRTGLAALGAAVWAPAQDAGPSRDPTDGPSGGGGRVR